MLPVTDVLWSVTELPPSLSPPPKCALLPLTVESLSVTELWSAVIPPPLKNVAVLPVMDELLMVTVSSPVKSVSIPPPLCPLYRLWSSSSR